LAVSVSAQIGTAPLVLYHFGVIYPVGIVAALLLIPLVTVYLAGGVLFVGSSFLPVLFGGGLLEGLIGQVLSLGSRSIALCLDLFSRLPGLYVSWRTSYWLMLMILLLPPLVEAWRLKRIPAC
jgi:competence protein ComEC